MQRRAVSRVNIVVKSNKFPFPMILVWNRTWVNIARYSVEDHLIGRWVGRRTHFVSGRQTVGCPREHLRRTRRRFFTPFLKVRSPSGVSGPRRTGRPMEWKSAFSPTYRANNLATLNAPLLQPPLSVFVFCMPTKSLNLLAISDSFLVHLDSSFM